MTSSRPLALRAFGALAVAGFLATPIGALYAAGSDPVVARANGVDIHESDLALAEEEIGGNMPAVSPERKREYLITYLTDVVVLSQAAEQQKLPDRPDVKRRLTFNHNRVLMEALLQDAGRAASSDAELHKVYDQVVKQMPDQEEVRARHILVPTEKEAKEIVAELKNGAHFATLAKEKSKDPAAAQGGELGWFTKDQMVPEFAAAAFKLHKGQFSDPVKTQFGWHIIQVEDRRVKPRPTFDEVKGQIEAYVAHRAQAALVEKLRGSAKIERFDKPAASKPSLDPAAPAKLDPAAPVKK